MRDPTLPSGVPTSPVGLERGDPEGTAWASDRGWAQDLVSPRSLTYTHPHLCIPPTPALPGKSLAGPRGEEAAPQRGPPLRAVNQGFVCANLEPRGAAEGRVWAGPGPSLG